MKLPPKLLLSLGVLFLSTLWLPWFSHTTLSAYQEQVVTPSPAHNDYPFPIAVAATPTPYPKVLPSGIRPFLNSHPFTTSYSTTSNLNSYFDHRLPLYNLESSVDIPTDIRDSSRGFTWIYTGEERLPSGNDSIDQGYAWYSGHNGIDYNLNGNILAPANGIIAGLSASTETPGYCGVWIHHDASQPPDGKPDYATRYLHLSELGKAPDRERNRENRSCGKSEYWCVGDTIREGETIGISGDDPCGGTSGGIHLHFGLAEGSLDGDGNPMVIDPYGWWSNYPDPWTDSRLPTVLPSNVPEDSLRISNWMWGMALNPPPGDPGYWGSDISAQVDDLDPGFQKFGSLDRSSDWSIISSDNPNNIKPLGTGAWRSNSLSMETDTEKKNSAVWGLYVPAAGIYQIQVYLPKLPSNVSPATQNAVYTVRFPMNDDTFEIWDSAAVDQRHNNEWITLNKPSGETDFSLRSNSTVLVELDDLTGSANQSVIFDAVRLRRISLEPPPPSTEIHRVGFVMDNSSSMLAVGKIGAVKAAVPPWIDQIDALGLRYQYAFNKFANNVISNGVTEDPLVIKSWIDSLSGNDNGIYNGECPEASLDAIKQLAPNVVGGDILLFTDDISFSAASKTPSTLLALLRSDSRLHAILLPKTCTFDGTTTFNFYYYRILATLTGGTYQNVTSDNTTSALNIVLQEMKANTQVGYQTLAKTYYGRENETTSSYEILVDNTLTRVNFLMDILSGTPNLIIYRPDGSILNSTDLDVTFINSGAGVYYSVDAPVPGTWSAIVGGTGEHLFRATGESSLRFTYMGDTYGGIGQSLDLIARLDGTVISPTFSLEDASGNFIADVQMQDQGMQGDYYAGDGVFVGQYTASISGDFRLRASGFNENGQPFSRTDARLIRVRAVSVQAPLEQIVSPGQSADYRFIITNAGDFIETYNLTATSGSDWLVSSSAYAVSIDPHQSIEVWLNIAVPLDAVPNSVNVLRLTAVNANDESIVSEDSTLTVVPDQDEQVLPKQIYLPLIKQ